jgi:hypothetical protein
MEIRADYLRSAVLAAFASIVLVGCADSAAIQPAGSSKAKFDYSNRSHDHH